MDYIAGHHRAGDIFALAIETTTTGTVGAGEDDLLTAAVPAALWSRTKKTVRLVAWGTTANTANAKTLKVYFGATLLLTAALTVSQLSPWHVEATIVRTGASAQTWVVRFSQGGTTKQTEVGLGTATEDDTAAITVKCTGEATSDDDLVQHGLIVEVLNG